jgi:hypothetical protein
VTYKYYTGVLAFLQEDYAKVKHTLRQANPELMCYRLRRAYRTHGTHATLDHKRTKRGDPGCTPENELNAG